MVFNATFNNISAISWWPISLVKETRLSGENHRLPEVTDKLYHMVLYRIHFVMSDIQAHNVRELVVIDTDCICSCKSNYHVLTTMTALSFKYDHPIIVNNNNIDNKWND